MVKTPRTRHSKTTKEPVTIDLSPGEISRAKAEAEKSPETAAGPTTDTKPSPSTPAASVAAAATAPKDEPTKAEATSTSSKPDDRPAIDKKPEPEKAKPAATSTASASSTASSSQSFGRNPEPPKPSTPPPHSSPAQAKSGRSDGLLAGVAGGVIALLLAGGAQYAGLLPSFGAQPVQEQQDFSPSIEALQSELSTLREQVVAIPAGTQADPAVEGRVTQAEESVSSLSEQLFAVRDEVAGLAERGDAEGSAPIDLSAIENRIAALEATAGELQQAASSDAVEERITALGERIEATNESYTAANTRLDAIEQSIGELSGRVDEAADRPATAVIVAASALKAAIDRGSAFMTEIETYASLAPDAPEIAELRDLAASGVPSRAQISAESDAAANAMIASVRTVDSNAGVADRLWASAMGLVQVRPVGMVEGEGVPEIVARLDAAVQSGDYERAIREFDSLPADAKAAGEPFMDKVRARAAADRLADQALAAALQN